MVSQECYENNEDLFLDIVSKNKYDKMVKNIDA